MAPFSVAPLPLDVLLAYLLVNGLGDSVGVLPDAARLRASLQEVQRDVEGVLRRRLQVRATRRVARHAVSHHGLVSVLLASHVQYRVPGSMWLCA